jgi:hypothetical protein
MSVTNTARVVDVLSNVTIGDLEATARAAMQGMALACTFIVPVAAYVVWDVVKSIRRNNESDKKPGLRD